MAAGIVASRRLRDLLTRRESPLDLRGTHSLQLPGTQY
ncbi:ECH1 isoform 6 [Pongo abelii]|uniref:ECH1 isoform 6 n=1 Tax=Pongo abelii TaxID=9601 RepID=A0A2J8SD92_PONAB|nr:ECH1 isoform 6 [Pongo abelii]